MPMPAKSFRGGAHRSLDIVDIPQLAASAAAVHRRKLQLNELAAVGDVRDAGGLLLTGCADVHQHGVAIIGQGVQGGCGGYVAPVAPEGAEQPSEECWTLQAHARIESDFAEAVKMLPPLPPQLQNMLLWSPWPCTDG